MKLGFKIFLELFILTLRRPFEAGQWIIAKRFSSELGWLSLLLVSIMGTVLVQLSFSMQPDEVRAAFAVALNSPLRMALVQGVFLVFRFSRCIFLGIWPAARDVLRMRWLLWFGFKSR